MFSFINRNSLHGRQTFAFTIWTRNELGLLERTAAAVWCIKAFKVEVPTTVTRCFAIAFDLPALTLVATRQESAFGLKDDVGAIIAPYHASEM